MDADKFLLACSRDDDTTVRRLLQRSSHLIDHADKQIIEKGLAVCVLNRSCKAVGNLLAEVFARRFEADKFVTLMELALSTQQYVLAGTLLEGFTHELSLERKLHIWRVVFTSISPMLKVPLLNLLLEVHGHEVAAEQLCQKCVLNLILAEEEYIQEFHSYLTDVILWFCEHDFLYTNHNVLCPCLRIAVRLSNASLFHVLQTHCPPDVAQGFFCILLSEVRGETMYEVLLHSCGPDMNRMTTSQRAHLVHNILEQGRDDYLVLPTKYQVRLVEHLLEEDIAIVWTSVDRYVAAIGYVQRPLVTRYREDTTLLQELLSDEGCAISILPIVLRHLGRKDRVYHYAKAFEVCQKLHRQHDLQFLCSCMEGDEVQAWTHWRSVQPQRKRNIPQIVLATNLLATWRSGLLWACLNGHVDCFEMMWKKSLKAIAEHHHVSEYNWRKELLRHAWTILLKSCTSHNAVRMFHTLLRFDPEILTLNLPMQEEVDIVLTFQDALTHLLATRNCQSLNILRALVHWLERSTSALTHDPIDDQFLHSACSYCFVWRKNSQEARDIEENAVTESIALYLVQYKLDWYRGQKPIAEILSYSVYLSLVHGQVTSVMKYLHEQYGHLWPVDCPDYDHNFMHAVCQVGDVHILQMVIKEAMLREGGKETVEQLWTVKENDFGLVDCRQVAHTFGHYHLEEWIQMQLDSYS